MSERRSGFDLPKQHGPGARGRGGGPADGTAVGMPSSGSTAPRAPWATRLARQCPSSSTSCSPPPPTGRPWSAGSTARRASLAEGRFPIVDVSGDQEEVRGVGPAGHPRRPHRRNSGRGRQVVRHRQDPGPAGPGHRPGSGLPGGLWHPAAGGPGPSGPRVGLRLGGGDRGPGLDGRGPVLMS